MTNSKNIKTIALLFTLTLTSASSFAGSVSKKQPPIVDEDVIIVSSETTTTDTQEDESLLEKMLNLLSF